LKDWIMIHKIKAMWDEGRGSSQRAIAEQLKISRNTVKKYLEMSAEEVAAYQERKRRSKRLDVHRAYIEHLLETYPRLSAVKVLRRLEAAHGELSVSSRTMRRYIEQLRETIVAKQARYYEPVLDMVPGEQCQVDGGELRGVVIDGVESTVYLMVFVLSYSRLMYVAASARPIDTGELIRMHDAAFRYFGGQPRECVYDQTKLVVIEEAFRELRLNSRFARYATTAGFTIRACEGYDPESKGKVEAGVKYVKDNGLYGEHFSDFAHLEAHLAEWLDTVANARVHASTGHVPREHYAREEQPAMGAYLTPAGIDALAPPGVDTRKADKTGLITYKANKYSVPLPWQRARVGVCEDAGQLLVCDPASGEVIARHRLAVGSGEIVKNTHHYRDREQQVADLEAAIAESLPQALAARLCALLKRSEPRIYRDQLRGVGRLLVAHAPFDSGLIERLCQKPRLTATLLRDHLDAHAARRERSRDQASARAMAPPDAAGAAALAHYAGIGAEHREVAR
jgi:transposase